MANILWDQFEKKEDGKAQCKICKSVIGCRWGTTSGFIKNLEPKHKEQYGTGTKQNVSDEGSSDGKKQTKLSFGVPDAALTKKTDEAIVSCWNKKVLSHAKPILGQN